MKKLLALLLSLCLLCGINCFSLAENSENPVIRISVNNAGDIYVELYPELAPITVENFLSLVDQGFYDGLTFHRIISGFMVQGGDPLGNGTGGSSQKIKGEFTANGVENNLSHTRGVISMARSSDMNSASSQFFIVHADSPHLDGNYAAFGKVLAGMGVVDRLCATTYVSDSNGTVLTGHAPIITSITRVDRAEAEEAMANEAANGKNGTFTDPTSFASVTVPEGWSLQFCNNGSAYFLPESDENPDAGIIFSTLDLYAYAAGINTTDAMILGVPREELDTSVIGKDRLLSMTGISEEAQIEEIEEITYREHTADEYTVYHFLANGMISVHKVIGANNGVVFLFTADANSLEFLSQMVESLIFP